MNRQSDNVNLKKETKSKLESTQSDIVNLNKETKSKLESTQSDIVNLKKETKSKPPESKLESTQSDIVNLKKETKSKLESTSWEYRRVFNHVLCYLSLGCFRATLTDLTNMSSSRSCCSLTPSDLEKSSIRSSAALSDPSDSPDTTPSLTVKKSL